MRSIRDEERATEKADYKFHVWEDGGGYGDPVTCFCCGYEAPTKVFQLGNPRRPEHVCLVCAGTSLSSSIAYNTSQDNHVGRYALYGTNAVLDQLGAFKDAETVILESEVSE